MKRVLFDTSVYGELVIDNAIFKKILNLVLKGEIVIYGIKIIRQELRDTPPRIRVLGKSKRLMLLEAFDTLVRKEAHVIQTGPLQDILAWEYYRAYRKHGGNFSWGDLQSDFLIVAAASLGRLDIIVSNDESTFLSTSALSAYTTINRENALENPQFIAYRKYKAQLGMIKSYKPAYPRSD